MEADLSNLRMTSTLPNSYQLKLSLCRETTVHWSLICTSWWITVHPGPQTTACTRHHTYNSVQWPWHAGCGQGSSQGAMATQSLIKWIIYRKNWLCLDIGPALFSKAKLFSLPEVFCWLHICQKYKDPPAGGKATIKKSRQLFWEKSAPSQLLCPPMYNPGCK